MRKYSVSGCGEEGRKQSEARAGQPCCAVHRQRYSSATCRSPGRPLGSPVFRVFCVLLLRLVLPLGAERNARIFGLLVPLLRHQPVTSQALQDDTCIRPLPDSVHPTCSAMVVAVGGGDW